MVVRKMVMMWGARESELPDFPVHGQGLDCVATKSTAYQPLARESLTSRLLDNSVQPSDYLLFFVVGDIALISILHTIHCGSPVASGTGR